MEEVTVEGSDTPSAETPPPSPAERFARLLSLREDGTTDEPDSGAAVPKKPTPGHPPDAAAAAQERVAEEGKPSESGTPADSTPRHKVKVDGEEMEITLEEALKGYSYTAHNTRTAQKLASERKAFEAEQSQIRELTSQYRSVLPRLEEIAQKAVDKYAGVDWEALHREDPAAFAEHRAAFNLEQDKLKSVQEERSSQEATAAAEQDAEFQGWVAKEQDALLTTVPEWKDEAFRSEELGKIAEFATKELGFTPEDLAGMYDHRLIRGLRMAFLGQRMLANAEGAKRKMSEARKSATPGAKQDNQPVSDEAFKRAREKLRKSGREQDAADALNAIFAK